MLPAYYQAYMNNLLLIGTFVVHPAHREHRRINYVFYVPMWLLLIVFYSLPE